MAYEKVYTDQNLSEDIKPTVHVSLLPHDDVGLLEQSLLRPKRLSLVARILIGFGAASFFIFAILLIVVPSTTTHYGLDNMAVTSDTGTTDLELPDKHYCGETSEEALERGCHYEGMLSCWIPDLCYTSKPSEGYNLYSKLGWYSDHEMQHPLTDEEMAGLRVGNFTHVWTTWEYHQHRCLHTWRELALAINRRIPYIDTRTVEFEHSQHCANIIANYASDRKEDGVSEWRTKPLRVNRTMLGCVKLF